MFFAQLPKSKTLNATLIWHQRLASNVPIERFTTVDIMGYIPNPQITEHQVSCFG